MKQILTEFLRNITESNENEEEEEESLPYAFLTGTVFHGIFCPKPYL